MVTNSMAVSRCGWWVPFEPSEGEPSPLTLFDLVDTDFYLCSSYSVPGLILPVYLAARYSPLGVDVAEMYYGLDCEGRYVIATSAPAEFADMIAAGIEWREWAILYQLGSPAPTLSALLVGVDGDVVYRQERGGGGGSRPPGESPLMDPAVEDFLTVVLESDAERVRDLLVPPWWGEERGEFNGIEVAGPDEIDRWVRENAASLDQSLLSDLLSSRIYPDPFVVAADGCTLAGALQRMSGGSLPEEMLA